MTEIIVEFPSPLTEREKKLIYGYKGEIVRCEECKHSTDDKLFGGLWCQHPTEKHCERNADFYCGSGERRTE